MVSGDCGADWGRHFREIQQDPERVHAQQRAAVKENAADSKGTKGMTVAALERHYIQCMEEMEQKRPSQARKEYREELEKGARLISQFSRRQHGQDHGQDLGRFIDIDSGVRYSQQARLHLQASDDWLARRAKNSSTSEGVAICHEAKEKISFVFSTPLLLVHLNKKGNEVWEKPTSQICVRYRDGQEVCRKGVYCKRLHFIPTKDCTNPSYLATGICSNYSKCHSRHPWDAEQWGDRETAHRQHQATVKSRAKGQGKKPPAKCQGA